MRGLIGKTLFAGMAALVLVSFGATGAEAATKKLTVWPDQFEITRESLDDTDPPTLISPDGLRGHGSYYAVISLPVGATIKRLWLNYTKDPKDDPENPSGPPYYSVCVWIRRKPATGPEEFLFDMFRNDSETVVGTQILGNAPDDVVPGAVLKVKSGYRYYVTYEPNIGGVLNSVQVEYTTP